jgi:murein DD-endopeptidase MepM/ murein hydrolase activator NlpD
MQNRLGGEHRSTRRVWLSVLVCVAATAVPMAGARADSPPSSDDVAREIVRIQGKADDAAERYAELDAETGELADQLADSQAAVDQAMAAFGAMQEQMASIAINRFMGGGLAPAGLLGVDPVPQLQVDALSAIAIGAAGANLDDFEALQADLESKQADLEQLQARNEQAKAQLVATQDDLQQQLTALAALEVKLKDAEVKRAYEQRLAEQRAKEQAAAAKVAAKKAAEKAAREAAAAAAARKAAATATTVASSNKSGGGADGGSANNAFGPTIVAPSVGSPAVPASDSAPPTTAPEPEHPAPVLVGGDWLCPVAGPKGFGHSFGDPRPGGRRHEGVDMMSPFGTPLVAVVSGNANFHTNVLGGITVGLKGDDGNYYYYAHLSSWEGSSRYVQKGEVMGYVGHTGDTVVNHLHFEIHPGGGRAVDPYNTLASHC